MPELMDIAEKLFVAQGYQHTMVSDIVKQAKVAQGSFYLMKQCTGPRAGKVGKVIQGE